MKRKLLATLIAVITVIACALGLTACGDSDTQEPSALEKAYQAYLQTPNMTVTVTDTRTEKYNYDLSAVVEIDHAHNAAHTTFLGFEHYYEITDTNGTPGFTIYACSYFKDEENETVEEFWSKIVRNDLFDERQERFDSVSEYAINLMNSWVSDCFPTHTVNGIGYCENENDDTLSSSLQWILNAFTESENGYSADIWFCAYNDASNDFVRYPCTATYKLDGQGRFESLVLDLGNSGKIKAEFTYGTASVIIPDEIKTSAENI